MSSSDDQGNRLAVWGADLPMKRGAGSMQRALLDRMTVSESVEAATRIVDCYPNGGKGAGKSYLGALAATLANYPRSVSLICADPLRGVVTTSEFLPSVAELVKWLERATIPLWNKAKSETRTAEQVAGREVPPRRHLTVEELKEKYGDWHDGWQPLGAKAQEAYDKARQRIVAEIGDDAFDALPDGPQQPADYAL